MAARLNRSDYHTYAGSKGRTDFKEFPGRAHWIIAQEGWEEVADYAARWLEGIA